MPARRTRRFELEKTERTIRQALNICACLAVITVLCLALMNFFAPPIVFPAVNYAASSTGSNSSAGQTQQAGNLSVTLQVLPARVGQNNAVILLLNNAQGQGISNARIKLSINMQIMNMGTASASLSSTSSIYTTVFTAGQTFSMAGAWSVNVEVDQPGQQAVHLTFTVMVQ